ncbi:MAG: PrsW family intramembrane metalloprotease [Chloroflexi bacterium]|nr:MAG: PrsW family intramembrane metalloprotease [Chloroflexota bacterium]
MTRYNSSRLLTPPREEEEIYPYRRVWHSLSIEMGGVFTIALVFYVLVGFVGINLPQSLWRAGNATLALSPAMFWLVFSWWRERRVPEPREHLTAVFIISGLAANAIGIPLITYLDVDQWLSSADTIGRILGYAFTVGITQETIKYLVVRYLAWERGFRIRQDPLAYCLTSAMSYATVANLHFALDGVPSPDIVAMRIFSITALHVTASTIVAFGMTELYFNPRTVFVQPFMLLLAAIVVGIGISFRTGLTNSGFVLGIGGTRPILGFIFSLVLMVSVLVSFAFLFTTTERQAQEAAEEET